MWRQRKLFMHTSFAIKIIPRREKETSGYQLPEVGKKYRYSVIGTVKYFSQKRLCKNEVLRREVRRGGCQAPLICPVAYSGGGVKGAASAAFIGVTGYGHADP